MGLSEVVITALIAAAVSLMGSMATYFAMMRGVLNQQKMKEFELSRHFTEKLYDLRLAAYPKAFSITDQLRGDLVFGKNLDRDLLQKVRAELLEWNKSDAGFLMSQEALKSFYDLRNILATLPEGEIEYSKAQRKTIWVCKNHFRGFLKADLHLLYQEERVPD